MSSARGLLATGVPPAPVWLLYIKYAILGLAVVVLALSAYACSFFGGGAAGFLIFIAIKTIIIYGGAIALEIYAPQYYFRIGLLIAYCLGVIFWLSAWAWAASTAAFWLSWAVYSHGTGGALAGCAALGAVAWILSIVNLVFFIKACLADAPPATGAHQAELGQVKQDPISTPSPAPAAAATEYPTGQYPQAEYAQPNPYPAEQQYPVQPTQPAQHYPAQQ
ncbi:hypothetical protein QBC33DRAFT_514288 [Phialemonium atrogriseum]|uniref:MARVEL domain-containing protein n=1 Tax=Phialemonium atrogriseum TaxID=1093897 RepID=A0AAJ0FM54_9PEZI|nr:uncharacterized protein QBC33DRAFT_514288 [Phialemonium atrogriseum]KAK1767998.1 hypothetical protein QBC33DRAFT_514288 [Phialemonium atrogriseum]